jgi:hypothetical protein
LKWNIDPNQIQEKYPLRADWPGSSTCNKSREEIHATCGRFLNLRMSLSRNRAHFRETCARGLLENERMGLSSADSPQRIVNAASPRPFAGRPRLGHWFDPDLRGCGWGCKDCRFRLVASAGAPAGAGRVPG